MELSCKGFPEGRTERMGLASICHVLECTRRLDMPRENTVLTVGLLSEELPYAVRRQ